MKYYMTEIKRMHVTLSETGYLLTFKEITATIHLQDYVHHYLIAHCFNAFHKIIIH